MPEPVDSLPRNPYPGLDPFTYQYQRLFQGRTVETRNLFRLVIMYRGVLLYGGRGVGKSSLLEAGLFPELIEDGFRPHRIRLQPQAGRELTVYPSPGEDGGLSWLDGYRTDASTTGKVALGAHELLDAVRGYRGNGALQLTFDQFEEWATLFDPIERGPEVVAGQSAVADAVIALIREKTLPVKTVLSFREDYLARFDTIFDRIPEVTDQYVRVLPLRSDQLEQAILTPFKLHPDVYGPEELDDRLAAQIVEDIDERAPTRPVEASEVQIVCRDLYDERKSGESYDTAYRRLGGASGLFEKHFSKTFDSIPRASRDVAIALLSRLISSEGTRKVVSKADLLRLVELEEDYGHEVASHALSELEQEPVKLVKAESREGVEYVEIVSEFLVEWIQDMAAQRAVRQRAEQEVERRRTKWTAVAMVVGLLVSAAAFFIGYRSSAEPPPAEIAAVRIPSYENLDTAWLFDGDETEAVPIAALEQQRQFKIEVDFDEVIDIIDVRVIPAADGPTPKSVHIASTRIAVPIGNVPVVGRGAYGSTNTVTLVVEFQDLDREVRIAELKFWRLEPESQ